MRNNQRGAVAVEFALLLPVLLILVLGVVEFGYLLFLNSSAAGAAREGAREMAISGVQTDAQGVASDAFTATTGRTATTVSVPGSCSSGSPVVVTVSLSYPSLTRFFGSHFNAVGTGEMRCGG